MQLLSVLLNLFSAYMRNANRATGNKRTPKNPDKCGWRTSKLVLSDTQKGSIWCNLTTEPWAATITTTTVQHNLKKFGPLTSSNHKLTCRVAVITQTTRSFAVKMHQSARDRRRQLGCGKKITSDWLLNSESRLVKDYKRSNKSGRRRERVHGWD